MISLSIYFEITTALTFCLSIVKVHILIAFILLIKNGADQVLTVSWDGEEMKVCNDCCF